MLNIDARNGFAGPANPVACGLSPTPVVNPDWKDGNAEPDPSPCPPPYKPGVPEGVVPEFVALKFGDSFGDCGMVGRVSRRAAPKEEEGLKALMPPNPVVCGCNGADPAEETDIDGVVPPGEDEAAVVCGERAEKTEEENVIVDDVAPVSKPVRGKVFERGADCLFASLPNENADATPDIVDDWPLAFGLNPVGEAESPLS